MVSLYEMTVPVFIAELRILSKLLNKGVEHVGQEKVSTLLEARLIEDMQPLVYQIQRISDTSKGLAVRVGGGMFIYFLFWNLVTVASFSY